MYTSDFNFPGHALRGAGAQHHRQRPLDKLDVAAAEKMPGVRAIFHRGEHRQTLPLRAEDRACDGIIDERRPPFEDDVIRYYGQYVALAVADTFEQAKAAADAVRATYDDGEA